MLCRWGFRVCASDSETVSVSRPAAEGRLWVVVGATGTGKSDLALRLAQRLIDRGRPAEIVNADAMQLYRGMDIGTAKLSVAERRGIRHHMLDVLDVTQEAAVAAYQRQARGVIEDIFTSGADAILVGGSGLYVSSVVFDFQFPPRDEALRARLESDLLEQGPGALFARLQQTDPETAARIDPHNGRRLVRALEVLAQGARTHGASLPDAPVLWHSLTHIVGLHVDRTELVERLDRRVEGMWEAGLTEEVQALLDERLAEGTTARQAIGYAQAAAELAGEMSRADAIAETQALTRRYARRQVSWFKRYSGIRWVAPDIDVDVLLDQAATVLSD